jgi:MFS superfamily sulfate permease-like transporter
MNRPNVAAVPGVAVLASYRREWLPKDVVAGLVLTALLVPQGMAYTELAGLPAITGLYTTILCLLGYAVFGPSKILVLGPDSDFGRAFADRWRARDALVVLADTISTASAFAARQGHHVHGNQEMIGIGVSIGAAGLFQGFPVSTSGSRTAVAEQAGAKTQVTGLVGAAAILQPLVVAPSLLRNLPQPTLAAVVIAASLALADIPATVRLWKQRRPEFSLSIAAFLGVALLGVLPGIALAVGLSIFNVFRRAWWPYQARLGKVDGLPGFHDVTQCRTFREEITELVNTTPGLRWIVLAAEPVTDVDTTAADMLEDLDEWLNAHDVSLVFAEMKDPVREKIERYELTRTIDPRHFLPAIDAAVAAYEAEFGGRWQPAEGGTT